MITLEDFSPCNFTVFFHDTPKNSYILQRHRGYGAEHTHAGNLGHDCLIINRQPPIKITSDYQAMELVNAHENCTNTNEATND